ncbi:AT-rich interactive domain containing protein 3B, partial [Dissostichus eleginoides]
MVDNSSSSKAQMPSMSQDASGGVGFPQSGSSGGMKLEAVMEQLQRQQHARLEMERKERKLREAHIMYAQQVAAQQAILTAARASGAANFMGKTLGVPGQNASRIPPRPFGSYSASAPQRSASPPIRVKQEPDEGLSPAGPQSATSPNGQADWGFDDQFRQNGSAGWNDEADSNRGRGEASRDFAKLYELDPDPKRKEFLDDLFTFMQKRGVFCTFKFGE